MAKTFEVLKINCVKLPSLSKIMTFMEITLVNNVSGWLLRNVNIVVTLGYFQSRIRSSYQQ